MAKKIFGFALILLMGLLTSSHVEARRRSHRGAAAASFFIGAFTGAALAGMHDYYDDCYYVDSPQYDFIYAGAPLYAYDYPTYQYAPVYAYTDTLYTIYPSYYTAY